MTDKKKQSKKNAPSGSTEQLDTMLRITTPSGWVALVAAGTFIVATVVWGIWGAIPQKVDCRGILMERGGLYTISTQAAGIIESLNYSAGDTVEEGAVVATIKQQQLIDSIKSDNEKLKELNRQYQQTKSTSDEEIKLDDEALTRKTRSINLNTTALKSQKTALDERLKDQKMLLKKGLVTKQIVLSTQSDIDNLNNQILNNANELKQLQINNVQLKNDTKLKLQAIQDQIDNVQIDLNNLQTNQQLYSEVVSPYSGTVVNLFQTVDQQVNAGTALLTVELRGGQERFLEAIMYAPGGLGKKIKQGMKAHIDPDSVEKSRYGSILGLVTYASIFPASSMDMQNILQNQDLVKSLTASGAPLEVRIALLPDLKTYSRYAWTSSAGPKEAIVAGSICNGSVVVEQTSPFRLIIPKLRKFIFEADNG